MITFNGLPLYRATLAADRDGVLRVSLVDDPAVQSQFEFFRASGAPTSTCKTSPALFAVQDEEKRLVRGVVLRADFPIYRRDNDDDPGYYVTFSKEVIRQAAEKYLGEGRANEVNLQHEDGSDVDGVQMVQFFIKDSAAGVAPEGFDAVADGSLFAEYHVLDDAVWDEIKAGTFRGFSVEMFYTLIPAGDMLGAAADPDLDPEDEAVLERVFTKIRNKMNLKTFIHKLAAVVLDEPEPQKFGSVTTDKGVLYWDGDEDLKAGDRVEVDNADGQREAAADGDYTTDDGKTIVVVSGEVSEIRDPEAQVAPEEEQPEEMARQRRAKFEESYDDKMTKIVEAIVAARGDDYGYLVDAGDDFAVWAYYGEETGWADKYVRYSVAWGEDGEASVSDPVDVRRAFVPLDFDDASLFKGGNAPAEEEPEAEEMARVLDAVAKYKNEIAELKAQVAEYKKQPAAKSAHDAFRGQGGADGNDPAPASKTGVKGLDKLARLMEA